MPLAALAFIRRVANALTPAGWLTVAVLIAFLLFGAYCARRAADGVRADQATAALKVERRASAARETAGVERSADVDRTRKLEKDLTDATAPFPDARPSDRRVAFNCQRLRNDGIDTRTVPACVRLEARIQAEPVAR